MAMPDDLTEEERRALGLMSAAPADDTQGAGMQDVSAAERDALGMMSGKSDSRVLQSLINGLTFGLRPRMQATIETGEISGPAYEAARDEQFRRDDAYRSANPVTSTALEIAGSLPTMFVPGLGGARVATALARGGAAPAQGLNMGQRLARAVAAPGSAVGGVGHEAGMLGAKASALYGGLASREEDAGGRATDALYAAPVGYAFGRGANALLSPAARVSEDIVDAVQVGSNAEAGARQSIRRGLERDGITTSEIRDFLRPDMGRARATSPQAVDDALEAYGRAINNGQAQAAARQAATSAYMATLGPAAPAQATASRHVARILQGYDAGTTVPLAIDELPRAMGRNAENMHWMRRAVANSPGPGRAALSESVSRRQGDLLPNFRQLVNSVADDPNYVASRQDLVARNRALERDLYNIGDKNFAPFDLAPVLDEANRTMAFRGGKVAKAMEEAIALMRGRPLPNGGYERHTIDTYIQAREELGDLIKDSFRVLPHGQEPTTATRHLMDLKTKLDGIVARTNPDWKRANDITRGGRSAETAMDDAARMTLRGDDRHSAQVLNRVSTIRNEVNELSRRLSINPDNGQPRNLYNGSLEDFARYKLLQSQIEAYRMGFAVPLHKALTGLGDDHNIAKLFAKGGRDGSVGPRNTLRTMLGDEDADMLLDVAERSSIATRTNQAYGNSQTTPLAEAMRDNNESQMIAGMMRALGYVTNPTSMLADAGRLAGQRLIEARNARLGDYLTRMSDDPGRFYALLRDLEMRELQRSPLYANYDNPLNVYTAMPRVGGAFGAAWQLDEASQ